MLAAPALSQAGPRWVPVLSVFQDLPPTPFSGVPGSEWNLWGPTSPPLSLYSLQGILRMGLEEVKQFFALNGSCRLPLSPSLLVKGIVPRVSGCGFGALQ